MAVIRFGVTVVGMRGTVGGLTFSENKNNAYVKVWNRGANPRSVGQTTTRGRFVASAANWQALTPTQRGDWDTFAASPNEADYDPWGVQKYLSGFQWYVRAQTRRQQVAQAVSATVPSGAAATAPTGAGLVVYVDGAGTSELSYDDGSFGATDSAILECALSQRVGKQVMYGGYRQIYAAYNPGNGPKDISAALLAAFGDLQSDWVVFGRLWKQAQYGNRSQVVSLVADVQT